MAARLPLVLTSTAFLTFAAAVVFFDRSAGAQDVQPQVENAKHAFEGAINSNAVFIRSGPSENFYPTMKLDKGAKVKVVGIKFNWLKIEPPAGSFSYVARAFVQRRGDAAGGVGRVTNNINVRAGSDLVATKSTVQTKLEANTDVKILGEQEEYFKIAPPVEAYLYVDQRFVDPLKPIAGEGTIASDDKASKLPGSTTGVTVAEGEDAAKTQPAEGGLAAKTPDTKSGSTSKPTVTVAEADPAIGVKFADLEARFQTESAKPLAEQSIDGIVTEYQTFSQTPSLSGYMKRAADSRLASLKLRQDAKTEYIASRQKREEMKKQQQALTAEGEELAERAKQNEVKIYSAVGVLRTSSLQLGRETLFRLTDPASGRTVVYIRSSDTLLPPLMNQFIGVRGSLGGDPQLNLRVIENINSAEAVDQTKVNGSIAAQIVPPSLLPRVPTAPTADASKEQTGAATEAQ